MSPAAQTGQPPNHMRYVVTVRNAGASALTHAALTARLTDIVAGDEAGTTAALVSASSVPAGIVCGAPSPGVVQCDIGRLEAGTTVVVTLGYTTSFTIGVTATRMDATVSVDESARDQSQPRDPNQEVRTVSNETIYESDANFGSTYVPAQAGEIRVATALSALSFATPGREEFFAVIQDLANDSEHCFAGVSCLAQSTRGDLTGMLGGLGPILWQRRLVDLPKKLTASSVQSVHFLDPVAVSVDPATDTFTAGVSFAGYDGVRFSSGGVLPAGLVAGADYFVVGATATTFKVSTRKNGRPVDVRSAGSGTLLAERVEVIGDTKIERWTSCTAPPPSLPAIVAAQVTKTVVDTCVWTNENGWMK